jgi:hypothetical protein
MFILLSILCLAVSYDQSVNQIKYLIYCAGVRSVPVTAGSVKSRTKAVQPQHQDEDEEEGDEKGEEEFEKKDKLDTSIPAKRNARDDKEDIEDEDETQLPDDYEARDRVQPGAQDNLKSF